MSVKNKQGKKSLHSEYDWFVLNAFSLQDSILCVIVMHPSVCPCVVTQTSSTSLPSTSSELKIYTGQNRMKKALLERTANWRETFF